MPTVIDAGALGVQGSTIEGQDASDQAGWSVAGAGDVNGDGFADIIIGAPLNGDYAGAAYVLYGGPDGFDNVDLGNLQPGDGFVIRADSSNHLVGLTVSGTGDVNGDGFDDIIVGA